MPSSLCAPVTERCLQCHTSPRCECTKGTRPLQQLSINMLKWELCVVFSREKGKTKTLLDLQRSSLFCIYYNPQAEKYPVPSEKEEEDPRAANRQIKRITACRAVTINVGLRGSVILFATPGKQRRFTGKILLVSPHSRTSKLPWRHSMPTNNIP